MINRKVFPAAPRIMDATGLYIDLYELTMAQAFFLNGMRENAAFEVSIRKLPPNWGFFVMAGLEETHDYLKTVQFSENDLLYLDSLGLFTSDFIEFLGAFKPNVRVRALPEGTVFFPDEPVVEVFGSIIDAQLLETYLLNILGFSILEATLAVRIVHAAAGRSVVDFGLRRAQGPISSLRAARGAQIAGFTGTSNVYASELLRFAPSGTMAHSFIQACGSEREAFQMYIDLYGEKAILLVDTYDCRNGIRIAAEVAKWYETHRDVRIRGIRIDSGDITVLSRYARRCFRENGVAFLKIFVSGGFDEYSIAETLSTGAEIDGFGIGTRFAVSHHAPDLDIVYKLVEYNTMPVAKYSAGKTTIPGRKSIVRHHDDNGSCTGDRIIPRGEPDDLLIPFGAPEDIAHIRERLHDALSRLDLSVQRIDDPAEYPVKIEIL